MTYNIKFLSINADYLHLATPIADTFNSTVNNIYRFRWIQNGYLTSTRIPFAMGRTNIPTTGYMRLSTESTNLEFATFQSGSSAKVDSFPLTNLNEFGLNEFILDNQKLTVNGVYYGDITTNDTYDRCDIGSREGLFANDITVPYMNLGGEEFTFPEGPPSTTTTGSLGTVLTLNSTGVIADMWVFVPDEATATYRMCMAMGMAIPFGAGK